MTKPTDRHDDPQGDDTPPQPVPTPDAPERGSVLDSIRAVHGADAGVSVDLEGEDVPVPSPSSAEDAPAASRYTSAEEIARGGMGAIFRVRDQELCRSLAMKVLLGADGAPGGPARPDSLNRFLEEAQVTAQLAHPGVVPVHELGIDAEGRVFFTMSLVHGKTLDEIVALARKDEDGWSMTRALQVILRVCETMAFAHDKGVIHRDLKPDNVMVGRFGETYVMDWGLAKVLGHEDLHDLRIEEPSGEAPARIESRRAESSADHDSPIMTMDGSVVGTPAYMPPEQALGRIQDVDARSDVYAIGALLYVLLTGRAPYVEADKPTTPVAVLLAVHKGPPTPVADIDPNAPEELVAICEKAMARERDERYATAEDLAEDLQRFLSGHVVRAHRTGALIELKKWVGRNKAVAATAAAALVAVAGVTGIFLNSLATEKQKVAAQRDRALVAEIDATDRAAEAERARDAKTVALRSVRALGLVSASREAGSVDSMRSLLLACAAVRTERTNSSVTRLREALSEPLETGVIGTQRFFAGATSVSIAWDGSRILARALLFDGSGKQIATLRHENPEDAGLVRQAAFSPDGSQIVTTAADDTACIWDRDGRRHAVLAGHEGVVHSAAFSSDGTRVITASSDKTVRLWDLAGTELGASPVLDRSIRIARLSADGALALVAFEDGVAALLAEELQTLVPLEGHTVELQAFPPDGTCTAFSPDGSLVVTARGKSPRLWSAAGHAVADLHGHEGNVTSVVFSPDGTRLLTASEDLTARLWNTSGNELAVLRGHGDIVWSAAFSPDGSRIVTASRDGDARMWDPDGEPLSVFHHPSSLKVGVTNAAISPDGSMVATLSMLGEVRLWHPEGSGDIVLTVPEGGVNAMAVSGDGSRIVTGSRDGNARVWDSAGREICVLPAFDKPGAVLAFQKLKRITKDEFMSLPPGSPGLTAHKDLFWNKQLGVAVAISEDGSRVVTGAAGLTARIWDGAGEEIAVLGGYEEEEPIVSVTAISPDGSRVVTCSMSGTARLWDGDGREIALLRHGPGKMIRVSAAAFAPDGSRLLTASFDHTARLWDRSGNELAVLRGHGNTVISAAFSPDGRRIVTASMDGTARLWDTLGNEIAILRHGENLTAAVTSAAFSPDGKRIVTSSGDQTARLWDAEGNELAVLRGHEGEVNTAAFSPDGTLVVTTSVDNTARLWNIEGGEIAVFRGHGGGLRAAAFLSDGARVATARDGSVRIRLVSPEALLARADELCFRDLTPEERERYAALLGDEDEGSR